MSDRVLGVALLVASTAGFAYYTVWTLALPFVDADQPLHRLFPPRHWAVALPAYAIAVRPAFCVASCVRCGALRRCGRQVVVSLVAAYAAKVMLLPERRKQARKAQRSLARCWTHTVTAICAQG
jgi:hypothetical protein